ncbi:Isochorismatase [hydrothermal vent metagenome]|uniref:Isochorismatase n=1 Tax=hydrothermal vent metagenome TaxID=652676 RepID=A0A3B0U4V8_9ZZZZ
MQIVKKGTVGLVVDVQERLFPVMVEKEKLLGNCLILITGLQELDVPLVVTQQYTKGLGHTIKELSEELNQITPIEKCGFSCCDEPGFLKKLKELNAKNIIICGIESHICVLQTAIDLKESGFNPIVVINCVSSRKKEDIELAKERFRFEKIMMASYESILFELTGSSSAPEFKTISKLVR